MLMVTMYTTSTARFRIMVDVATGVALKNSKMSYDIAVVIATYKRPALLRRCLDCLTRQTLPFTRYEVIVISDGPDEETMRLAEAFRVDNPGLNFKYSNTSKNEGPASARNKGWQLADAQWIAFTDDDCLPERGWLENFLRSAGLTDEPVVWSGRVIVPTHGVLTDYEKNISALESADFVTANCCVPKTYLEKVGGFDTNYQMAWREDSDLHFKFLHSGITIEKTPHAIVVHPVRKAGWGVSLREQRKSMYNALLFKKYPSYYRLLISPHPVWKYYVIVVSLILGLVFLLAGDYNPAIILITNFWLWVLYFTGLRLKGTSKSFGHITEMLVTSILIPFISIYWTIYGSFKYKVFFL